MAFGDLPFSHGRKNDILSQLEAQRKLGKRGAELFSAVQNSSRITKDNPAIRQGLMDATKDYLSKEGAEQFNQMGPQPSQAKDNTMSSVGKELSSGGEKWREVLKILGQAAAVYGSNDPGAALQRQYAAYADAQEMRDARSHAAKERRAEREHQREQFQSEQSAIKERDERRQAFESAEREESQKFSVEQELDRFIRESGFRLKLEEKQHEMGMEELKFKTATRDREIREQSIRELTLAFGEKLATFGQGSDGNTDPLSRARRVATAYIDGSMDELSDEDRAVTEFMLRKQSSAGDQQADRIALIRAAASLVGKPQPIPETRPRVDLDGNPVIGEDGKPEYEVVTDPTGSVVYKRDRMNNILEVPMSQEEALAFVAMGFEKDEFVNTRTPDPRAVERAEEMAGLVVDPGKIEVKHFLSTSQEIGLFEALAGNNYTPQELSVAIDQWERDMQARGMSPFSKKSRDFINSHIQQLLNEEEKLGRATSDAIRRGMGSR